MNHSRSLRTLLHVAGLAACALLLVGVRAANADDKDNLDVAIVNGEHITLGQLNTRLLEQRGDLSLDKMISRVLLKQAAKERNLVVSPDEIDVRLKELQDRFRTDEAYHGFLKSSGLSEDQYREEIRNTILLQKVARKDLPIADAELELTDARIIVVPDDPKAGTPAKAQAESKAQAERWIAELNEGKIDFSDMASNRNSDPGLRRAKGHLLPFLKIEMLTVWQAIEDQKLRPSTYTKIPVRLGTDRWAIIRLDKRIPISINGSAAERDRLLTVVTEYHCQQWLEQARKGAKITRAASFNEPVAATVNGEPITREQLAARLLAFSGTEALAQMVNRTLLLQGAKKVGVTVTAEEADHMFLEVQKSALTPDAFQSFLTHNNLTEVQFKDELRYREMQKRVALKESPVMDEDLSLYSARLVEVATRKDADEVLQNLANGDDFAKLVQVYSVVDEAKPLGGLTTPFVKTDLLDVWRAIQDQKLAPGMYTKQPVLLPNRHFLIIKLENVKLAAALTPDERKKLSERISDYRTEAWLDNARSSAKCEYPTTLSAALLTLSRGS